MGVGDEDPVLFSLSHNVNLNVVKKGRWACFQSFTIADRIYILWGTFNVTRGDLWGMLETLVANRLKVPL